MRVFVDDGCVYSKDEKNHINDLTRVFVRLAANHVALKPVKCIFGTDNIILLGHEVLARKGIRPDPDKVKAILTLELPPTVDALHNFVGATSWVSKFIPEYAELVKPLRDIIHSYDKKSKASIQHEWQKERSGEVAKRAFETLRLSLASRPCLAFPDFNKPFIIITDASKVAVAAVLCQMSEDGELRPIAYASTPLTDAEKKFGISALEGHALCYAVKKWRHLLYNTTTICITDNSALKSLTSPAKTFENQRMARMALALSEHDLVIAHRPGISKELIISDMLSRCGMDNNSAKLESLMEQAWGCVGQICRETKLELSRQVMSSKAQQRRLQHFVDASTVSEMINNKEITTVRQMVEAITSGERDVQPPVQQGDDTTSRFVEMYDMITMVELAADKEHVSDDDVLAAQVIDPFCKQMKQMLCKSDGCRTSTDQLYKDCKWQAPYHTVTKDGLLRRLLWKKGSKADAQVLEGRAPAVVPEGAKALQQKLCEVIHAESGHAKYTKTYSNVLDRYIWSGMTTDIADVVRTCNQCNFHGDKLPKAPIEGHVTAAEPAQRVMMDVVHMKEVEGHKYLLTLVDVFSRWAMAIPLENIKAATVTKALRRQAIPAGMGRPPELTRRA